MAAAFMELALEQVRLLILLVFNWSMNDFNFG